MARNFNFQAVLSLTAANFKKGANEVKNSLHSLESEFKAFASSIAAGFSVGIFLDKLKDSALDLNTAMNTLHNVSKLNNDALYDYSSNLKFVDDLANKYGQDILALTDSFAKFTASCYGTNVNLEEQRRIFESLTRAAAYYHLSADQTHDMMNAVNQMMSKGKIAAEELRRQLGNTLPGAFNLMAKAVANGSTAKLDEMMKKGELLATKYLPMFATELDKVTEGGNFESLQNSLNRFGNEWIRFVDKTNADDIFKGLVDSATKAMKFIGENIDHVVKALLAIGTIKVFDNLFTMGGKALQSMVKELETLETKLISTERRLKQLEVNEYNEMDLGNGRKYYKSNSPIHGETYKGNQLLTLQIDYNKSLLKTYELRKRIEGIEIFDKAQVENIKKATAEMEALRNGTSNIKPVIGELDAAFSTLWVSIKTGLKSIAKATFWTAIIQLIYEGISWIVDKFNELEEAAEKIKSIGDDYKKNIEEGIKDTEIQINKTSEYLRIIGDVNESLENRKKALSDLAEATGKIEIEKIDIKNLNEGSEAYIKLAKSVDLWAQSLEKKALIDIYTNEVAKAIHEQEKLREEQKGIKKEKKTKIVSEWNRAGQKVAQIRTVWEYPDRYGEIYDEIDALQKNIDDARAKITALGHDWQKVLNEIAKSGDNGDTNDDGEEESPLEKVYKDYKKEFDALKRQLKEGAILKTDYDKELKKLYEKFYKEAASTGELFIADILNKQESGKTLNAMEKWYLELAKNARESIMNALFEEGDEFFRKLSEQTEKDLENALTQPLDRAQKEMQKKIKEWHKYINMYNDYVLHPETRDPLFDYNKSKSDILGEELQIAENNVDRIKDILNHLYDLQEAGENVTNELSLWSEELEKVQANASNIYEAMNIAKLREDIKKLSEDLGFGVYDSIVNIVGGIDSIVNSFQRMEETLKDFDASGWEKFMSVFDAFINVANFGIGLYETINSLMEIGNKLKLAEAAEQTLINKGKADEAQISMASSVAKGVEAQMTQNMIAARAAEVAAMIAQIQAAKELAVAQAVAASAAVPFPGNIAAMGASAAAAIAAMSLPKFENGGIMGGSSTRGDRNLARINSGEMILNKSQQATLFNAIKTGNIGTGGGEWKVKGTDLIKVINNTQSKLKG